MGVSTRVTLAIALIATGSLAGAVWAQPVGTVLSHQKISNTQGNFVAPMDDLDELGGAVASLGDLDGNGPSVAALAVGAIGDDDGGGNRGAVYILFLNSSGSVLSQQKISNMTGGFTGVLANLDDFGSSLAFLGDLDGAGPSVAALAVGAAGDDDGGSARGAVWILFLNSNGTVLSHRLISHGNGGFPTGQLDNADEFGGAVATLGDLDGAGASVMALAVGAIGDDGNPATPIINAGATYILFLDSTGLVLSFQKISAASGGFNGAGLAVADEFGSSMTSLGDLDGMGPSPLALAVGTIGEDDGGTDAGCVYVLFLNSAGSVLSHQRISETTGGFTGALANGDEFGGSLANLGDLDRYLPTGVALATGAIGDAGTRGAVYVLFLNPSGTVSSHLKIGGMQGGFTGDIVATDEFGGALCALGDIDGSGQARQTLVAGASFDDDGGPDRGAVYVLFQKGLVTSDTPADTPRAPHALGQATPNPFNPRTTIPFRIGAAGFVEIGIWDARGRQVRQLVPGHTQPGAHAVGWDGRDDAGRVVPSGTYFYGMRVDGRAVGGTEKAILLK